MKKIEIFISILLIIILLLGCKDDDDNPFESGPEIEWISGGTTITYTYSGGVISGYNFYRSFNVINKSGEVSISVQVLNINDTKVTGKFNVEAGKQYSLKVSGSKKSSKVSSPGAKCLTVVFTSPNSSSKQEIQVTSYAVSSYNEWVGDTYYCPTSLTFSEINISE